LLGKAALSPQGQRSRSFSLCAQKAQKDLVPIQDIARNVANAAISELRDDLFGALKSGLLRLTVKDFGLNDFLATQNHDMEIPPYRGIAS
jgi:hypothetical protein